MWMAYALLAACCFGMRGILYHWSSQQPMNRELMLFGVFTMGAVFSLIGTMVTGQQWSAEALIGIAMGVLSVAANAAMYKGFSVGKASLVAILTGMPPLVVALLAYLVWGESITGWKLAAFAFIIIAVILLRYSNDLSLKNLKGAQWGLLAMLFFGLNDMTGKQSTLLGADTLPTMFYMFTAGSLLFGLWWALAKRRNAARELAAAAEHAVQPWSERKTFLWGMAVGLTNTFGMMLIITAFSYGITGLVSAVVSLNVLVILLYTRIYTKERFKRLELAGIVMSLCGIMVLRLFS